MTHDVKPDIATDETGNADTPYARAPEFDGLLHVFASTQSADDGITVTVSANGTLITGTVVSRDKWLARQAELIDPHGETGVAGSLSRWGVDALTADYPDFVEYYLHLDNARYLSGGQLVPTADTVLARVRLSEVGAWNFGQLGPGQGE